MIIKVKSYYAILNLEYPATRDEIKKAFHKLAHVHHPDKGGDEEKFKKINEAYSFLIQSGYWDMLAKEKRAEQAHTASTHAKQKEWTPSVFVSDDGKTFWTEDSDGNVKTYWTSGESIYDGMAWQREDFSDATKDYPSMYNASQIKS